MDTLNRKMGNDTMMLGVQQFPKEEKTGATLCYNNLIRHDHRSKCYTTDIDEIIRVE